MSTLTIVFKGLCLFKPEPYTPGGGWAPPAVWPNGPGDGMPVEHAPTAYTLPTTLSVLLARAWQPGIGVGGFRHIPHIPRVIINAKNLDCDCDCGDDDGDDKNDKSDKNDECTCPDLSWILEGNNGELSFADDDGPFADRKGKVVTFEGLPTPPGPNDSVPNENDPSARLRSCHWIPMINKIYDGVRAPELYTGADLDARTLCRMTFKDGTFGTKAVIERPSNGQNVVATYSFGDVRERQGVTPPKAVASEAFLETEFDDYVVISYQSEDGLRCVKVVPAEDEKDIEITIEHDPFQGMIQYGALGMARADDFELQYLLYRMGDERMERRVPFQKTPTVLNGGGSIPCGPVCHW